MVRLDPEKYEWALSQAGCVPMEFTGRALKGFVWVNPEGYDAWEDLEAWLDLALEFNPRAKVSKRRKSNSTSEKKRTK